MSAENAPEGKQIDETEIDVNLSDYCEGLQRHIAIEQKRLQIDKETIEKSFHFKVSNSGRSVLECKEGQVGVIQIRQTVDIIKSKTNNETVMNIRCLGCKHLRKGFSERVVIGKTDPNS